MPEKILPSLEGVAETLLMTLYARARESQRSDAMIRDEKAVEMVNQLACDFSRLRMQRHDEIAVIPRMKRFDNYVREFLDRNPNAVVVHIGCGLDTRFERVDNGCVEWFDLDMPEVIEIHRKLLVNESPRYHVLATSVFENGWLEQVKPYKTHPFMFVAEGVFHILKKHRLSRYSSNSAITSPVLSLSVTRIRLSSSGQIICSCFGGGKGAPSLALKAC